MNYSAKPIHLIFSGGFFAAGSWFIVSNFWFGVACWGLGALSAIWIFIAGLWQAKIDFNYSLAAVAREIREMNTEQWQALGIRYPELRIRFNGKPIEFIEDTDIRLESLQRFLDDGDEYQFAPERLYGDGTQIRRQWLLTRDWLIENKFLIESSAAGNHSWLWRSGRRSQLITMYFNKETKLINLNQAEGGEA